MVMEGIDQQLKRHAGVVDQRLRPVRRTQRALREAQRLHRAVDAIEGEQRRQVAQGARVSLAGTSLPSLSGQSTSDLAPMAGPLSAAIRSTAAPLRYDG